MQIPRLAALPLLLFAAFAAAQTTPVTPPANSQPTVPFNPEHPCASAWVICDTFGARSKEQAPFTLKPVKAAPLSVKIFVLPSNLTTIPAPKTCYTVRAYEYSTTNPDSGRVRRTGVTTCQPSTNFHMKSATLTIPR